MPKTGATRYQKFLKSEKSKTKLKAKKDLPKGTNVTKTNFKVKKIVIKEQLKKHDENELLSARKLNVKELLSRLNHFNVHSRTEALQGLKELITSRREVLDLSLGQLIHGVTPLILNVEKVVRHESLKVLHAMLSNVPLEKIDPFFDILCTYLRSAMTHIDNRIQDDSLLFLDILLRCTPNKVSEDFHKIIPNFLDMISKLRVDSKPGRTLTVNLDSKLTSVKWRVKVLHRLQDFLHKHVQYSNIQSTNSLVKNITHSFDGSKLSYYPLCNPNYITVSSIPCLSSKNLQDSSILDEVEKFRQYIDTLMPLLFETWLEVCPNSNAESNMETVVSEDAAILLRHILEVITLLWDLVQKLNNRHPTSNIEKQFSQKYKQPFSQHFVKAFPYVTNVRTKQTKSTSAVFEDTVTDPKLVNENLELCHLFINLNPNVNTKTQSRDIAAVLNYIEKIFNQNAEDTINDSIVKILNTIFSSEVNSWTRTLSIMEALFKKIIWAYFNKGLVGSFKQKIFTVLCKIALNEKLTHFHKSEAFEMWLIHLPDILLEDSIKIQTIDIIHKFAVCNNNVFNTVIKPKLLSIIVKLPSLIVSDSVNDSSSYHKLFSIFYWVKCWDDESLNTIEKQLMESSYRRDHGRYLFDTLRLKSLGLN